MDYLSTAEQENPLDIYYQSLNFNQDSNPVLGNGFLPTQTNKEESNQFFENGFHPLTKKSSPTAVEQDSGFGFMDEFVLQNPLAVSFVEQNISDNWPNDDSWRGVDKTTSRFTDISHSYVVGIVDETNDYVSSGVNSFSGSDVASGVNSFTGNDEVSGVNSFSGNDEVSGINSFSGSDVASGVNSNGVTNGLKSVFISGVTSLVTSNITGDVLAKINAANCHRPEESSTTDAIKYKIQSDLKADKSAKVSML